MKIYHRTSREKAEAILDGGFTGRVRVHKIPTGRGKALLEIDLPEEALEPYDHKQGGWHVPAEVLNTLARFRFKG